jgi:predicted AAA+ superfamily ATPase
MIPRLIEKKVFRQLSSSNKIVLILGARQVGKTTLLNSLQQKLQNKKKKILYLNCDLDEDRKTIDTNSLTILKKLTSGLNFLLIDEIQRVNNAGLTLKIIHDNIKTVKVIATGSSSFDLKNKMSDALTGRYIDFILCPLSLNEILTAQKFSTNKILRKKQVDCLLNEILTYGLYPEVYLEKKVANKILLLKNVVESYLFKDILTFQKIRYSQTIKDLTQALSYQIGQEVSENELSNRLRIDRKTVASYIDILEKSFVVLKLFPFSKNPRREIGRKYKVYFVDLGIRNGLIGDFNPLSLRSDIGGLWENFLLVERLKIYANKVQTINTYFWRGYGGGEVDYIERETTQRDLSAFEFTYSDKTLSRGAFNFSKNYKTHVALINKDNYLDFLSL